MADIESGHDTASSKDTRPRTNGARSITSDTNATTAAGNPSVELHFDTPLGLLRKLHDERDADARLDAETLALAHIWTTRTTMVPKMIGLLREWLRGRRSDGAEGIFLSVLSGVRACAPELWEEMIAFAGCIEHPESSRGSRLFVDLSIEGRALLSLVDMRSYRGILEALSTEPVATIDVGRIVRGLQNADDGGRVEERYMQCVANWIFAGGEIGMMMGAGGGPAGMLAGAFMGASSGASLGSVLCSGMREKAALASDLRPGPFNPGPVLELNEDSERPDLGIRGNWCWTWPYGPRPWWPPFPMVPGPPVPPRFPTPMPGPFFPRPELLESASMGRVMSAIGLVGEALGPNAYLVHGLPDSIAR